MAEKTLKLMELSVSRNRWAGVFFVLIGMLLFLSLFDYSPDLLHKSTESHEIPFLGKAGLLVARVFLGWLGIAAWLIPWVFINLGISNFKKKNIRFKCFQSVAIIVCCFSIALLANLKDHHSLSSSDATMFDSNLYEHGAGGSVGAYFYSGLPFSHSADRDFPNRGILRDWLGPLGTILLSLSLLLGGAIYHIRWQFNRGVKIGSVILLLKRTFLKERKTSNSEPNSKLDKAESSEIETSPVKRSKFKFNWFSWKGEDDLLFEDVSLKKDSKKIATATEFKKSKVKDSTDSNQDVQQQPAVPKSFTEEKKTEDLSEENSSLNKPETPVVTNVAPPTEDEANLDGFKVVRAAKTEKAGDLFPERKGDYQFPTLDLLMDPPEEESNEDEDHMIKARNLKETLSQFKIEIELGEVHTGPVITRYDVHPAAGVRVEKIANLDKNLAMALKADSVRILAPVPGKGCVGIEVPNQKPAPVCLKEILQSKAWAEAGAEIPIVLGKEASGRALVADLTKMPHLLVAGSTGSGKTVCINAIIASLCYYSSPEDVRFIMVDPKIVEMKVYNDLPHMLIPVVTEPKKVPGALKWLLVEMERRYQIFSKVGVRNIAGFNAKILKDKEEKEKAQLLDAEMTAEERAALSSIEVPRDDDVLEIPENKLPYIVCIIDELADLMMVAQADVETGIARLAQLARAAGIHLIIATQRPSVNVITGVIKANLPSRISFRVASYRDSQTILDGKGAEALIGKGDMLFIPPGSSTFLRAQGAFVSDDEINGIVEYLKVNGPPQIIEEVREQIESAGEDDVLGGGEDSDEDPMVRKAIEVIRTTKRASTSNLQRKLSIGYNRAARIMDDLEDRGLVGPDLPGQGREILMDL